MSEASLSAGLQDLELQPWTGLLSEDNQLVRHELGPSQQDLLAAAAYVMEDLQALHTQSVHQIPQITHIKSDNNLSKAKARSRVPCRHMVASRSSGRRMNGSVMSSPNTFASATTAASCVLTMEHGDSTPIRGRIFFPNTSSACIFKPTIKLRSKDNGSNNQVPLPHTTIEAIALATYPTLPAQQQRFHAAPPPLPLDQSPKPSPSATVTFTPVAG